MTHRNNRRHVLRSNRVLERGIGGVEVLPIGLLVITILTFMIIGAWNVIDAKMGTIGAAREAARTTVETFEIESGRTAGTAAWRASGRTSKLEIVVQGDVRRCGRLLVTATAEVAPVPLPLLESWGTLTVSSIHSEVVDPYRSGLEGEALC
jgi:hypothetical protein